MPTDPNAISTAFDETLYRIRSRTVMDITPFTYRDGLTFLQIIERIRQAVVETIEFCNDFGADIDLIIKAVNKTTLDFIDNVNKNIALYDAHIDDRKASIDQDYKNLTDFIKSYESRIIATAFTFDDEDKISATAMDGSTISMMAYDAVKRLLEGLRKDFEAFKKEEAEVRARDIAGEAAAREAGDNARFTKAEADQRFVRIRPERAVFIGSSNCPSSLIDPFARGMGWEAQDFHIGGGAFTSAVAGQFETQARNAVNTLGQDYCNTVTHVVIVDMLNDIRAQNNVYNAANSCFAYIKEHFPIADITVVPVLLNMNHQMNGDTGTQRSVTNRISECLEAGAPYGVRTMVGSQSWFYDSGSSLTDKPGEVHFTDQGYLRAAHYMMTFFRGGYIWRDKPWTRLADYGQPQVDRGSTSAVAKRERDVISIRGSVNLTVGQTADQVFMNVPDWAIPKNGTFVFPAMSTNREWGIFYINNLGQIAPQSFTVPAGAWQFNLTYTLW